MVAEADAVVVGRYLPGARFVESGRDRDGYYAPPSTLHPFEVMTVVRAALRLPTPGETIAIELLGGLREHSTHFEPISVRPGLRRLGVGRLYAIFLKWNPRWERFEGWTPLHQTISANTLIA